MANKTTHPLMQMLIMIAFSLIAMLLLSVATTLLAVFTNFDASSYTGIAVSNIASQLLCFALPVAIIGFTYYRGNQNNLYRLHASGRYWLLALVGIAIMLLISPINERLTLWNEGWDLGRVGDYLRAMQDATEGILQTILGVDTWGGLALNLLMVAILPAVCEELFFRAGIQNLMLQWVKNRHVAIWLTAIIFSLGHAEVFAFVPRLVLGGVLGYLYVYGGSLIVNVVAHCINNATVVVLYWLVARGTIDIDLEAPLNCTMLLAVCCALAAVGLFYATFVVGRQRK